MKKIWRQWGLLVLLAVVLAAASGCGEGAQDEEDASQDEIESVIYPVSINGTEIRVGETTVQTLLDQGFRITVSEMTEDQEMEDYEVDPESQLEANNYYTGGTVWITESTFMHISLVTPEDHDVKMGDAVIAYMDFALSSSDKEGLEQLLFNGVPVTEISRDKAEEMFPDFTGDDARWYSPAAMHDYSYVMNFTDGALSSFEVEKKYDIDWSGEQA